ncbi:MAG TPA: HAD family hydrolase [Gemmatimonadaceae bacterium]|nr:HAD family hydrolase [Gemmatimonadaceae bacterium]
MTTPPDVAQRPAVFLDRDGTINVDTHYLRCPEGVQLIPGAAEAIARLNAAGVPVIVVSNQSGIGRGLVTKSEYEAVRARIAELLERSGARIDATYICPHAPSPESGAALCECRKPGTLLFRTAAAEHSIDLGRSTFIGDRWRDVSPALELGGRGILVPSSDTAAADIELARGELAVANTLGEAVENVLRG